MRLGLKVRFLRATAFPIAIYGCESWAVMDGEENEQIGVGEDWVCFDVEKEYCITLYFRGRKISRKVNLKYFREKIFSRIYCSRENIFPRKYLPAKISSRENILSRKYLPAKISSRENRLLVSSA